MNQNGDSLAKLLGFAVYILLASVGAATGVYGLVYSIIDLVINVSVSIAHIAAAIVGPLVCYALYSVYAEEIHDSLKQLRTNGLSKYLNPTTYGVVSGVAVLALAFVLWGRPNEYSPPERAPPPAPQRALPALPEIVKDNPVGPTPTPEIRPIAPGDELIEPPKSLATVLVPLPRPRGKNRFSRTPPVDVCNLGEVFSNERYKACLADIRKHPDRKGVGGGPELPLDIRPPAQRNRAHKPHNRNH